MNPTAVLLCAHGRRVKVEAVADRGQSLVLRLGQVERHLNETASLNPRIGRAFRSAQDDGIALVKETNAWTLEGSRCCRACASGYHEDSSVNVR